MAGAALLAAVAQPKQMIGELLSFAFGASELRLRRLQRSFGDPPLGAHCGLPSEQFGKRRLGFA